MRAVDSKASTNTPFSKMKRAFQSTLSFVFFKYPPYQEGAGTLLYGGYMCQNPVKSKLLRGAVAGDSIAGNSAGFAVIDGEHRSNRVVDLHNAGAATLPPAIRA